MYSLRPAALALMIQVSALSGTLYNAGSFSTVRDQHSDFTQGGTANGQWTVLGGDSTGFTTGIQGITAFATAVNASTSATLSDSKVGDGSASADLELPAGIMRTSAMAGGASMSSTGQVTYDDALHWTVAGASAQTVTDLNFSYVLDGSLQSTADGVAYTLFTVDFGTGNLSEAMEAADSTVLSSFCPGLASPCIKQVGDITGWVSSSFVSNTPGLIIFNAVYAVTGASGDILMHFDLGSTAGVTPTGAGSAAADYSNTAQIGLTGPATFSFTSDSGQFLTGVANSVPEPSSLILIGAGFAALALVRFLK
jgi:hypothetical protein